ncbi:unnamed protein product [Blepharisma stoltei]|uniref:carbonic anhydrase n=1 Tax=Blepharisma stoltei TaxID=1481888 RepID=A0AAU9IMK4_9CILI|nr:unnamed protein product [Blepharisma stoltei]
MKIFCLIALTLVSSLHVSYHEGGDDWTDTCQNGTLQSPIAIRDSESEIILVNTTSSIVLYPDFKPNFTMGHMTSYSFAVYSDWGNLAVAFPSKPSINLHSSAFHFHSPSEYTLNGKYFDLEMHIVMKNPNVQGSLYVLGIFFDVNGKTNNFISQVIESESNYTDVNLMDVFNGNSKIEKFYEFEGSLTTPPCTEGVKWFLWSEVQDLDESQRNFFHKFWAGNSSFAGNNGNNRNLQERNDRLVIKYGESDDMSIKLEFSVFLLVIAISLYLS